MAICQAISANTKRQCERTAVAGSDYCWQHDEGDLKVATVKTDIPEDLAVRVISGGEDSIQALKEVAMFCIKNGDLWMACIIQNEIIQRIS